jgi:hypothetical protein
LLLVLLFKRRSSFPRVAIVLLVAAIALQVSDLVLMKAIPGLTVSADDISKVVGGALGVMLWAAYLSSSQRVKATFVRRYRASVPPLPEPAVAAGAGQLTMAGEASRPE